MVSSHSESTTLQKLLVRTRCEVRAVLGQNIWGLGPSHHLPSPSLPLEVGLLKYSYGPLAGGLGQCPLTAEIEFCALNCSFKI